MKKLTCIVFFLLPMLLQAQQMNVDSLVNLLETKTKTPADQLDIYYKIYYCYINYDLDKAYQYAIEGLKLSEKRNDANMSSKFNAALGRIFTTKSSYDTALVYWNKAMDNAITAKNANREASANLGIGILYVRQYQYVSALEYFLKALSCYENMGDNENSIKVLGNIADMYRSTDNNERAIYYLEKAKKITEKMDDSEAKMYIYFQLGSAYYTKYDSTLIDQALEYAKKAYEMSLKFNNKTGQSGCAQLIATIYLAQLNNYDQALEYCKKSLSAAEDLGDQSLIAGTWSVMSNIYNQQKRYQESESAALKAWAIDSSGINTGIDVLSNIVYANIMLNNKEKATVFFNKFKNNTHERIEKSNQEIIANMEVKYETQKKEIRITALEKERKLYTISGIAVMAALLLGLGLLFYRHRLSIQKQKQLEKEKELIAARSALDAEKAEREIIARDLHDGVGAMLSVVKNNMNIMKSYSVIDNKEVDYFNKALDGLDKSIVELRRVAHHIMPAVLMEKGLFAALDDFCRSIPEAEFHYTEPERRFDSEKELVLYRCAYELVNNAMKHAGATKIEVHLNVDETTAYLSVVDNGCGFDLQNASQGMGIKNLRTRLSAFGGNIEFFSEPGKGTEANVELPL